MHSSSRRVPVNTTIWQANSCSRVCVTPQGKPQSSGSVTFFCLNKQNRLRKFILLGVRVHEMFRLMMHSLIIVTSEEVLSTKWHMFRLFVEGQPLRENSLFLIQRWNSADKSLGNKVYETLNTIIDPKERKSIPTLNTIIHWGRKFRSADNTKYHYGTRIFSWS